MSLMKIVTVPEPVLRRRAHKVTDFGADLQVLIDDMIETVRAAPGVGLAAPQVDVPQRVIVVEFGDEEDEQVPAKLYIVVNPEIVRPSQETEKGTEACLSVPGFLGEVERVSSLTVKGQNRHGKPIRIKAKGWLARIFQHEIDHLDGILFTDRALWVRKIEDGEVVPLD
jgi:peptide deformylase